MSFHTHTHTYIVYTTIQEFGIIKSYQHIFCSSFKDCPKTKNFKMLENSYLNTQKIIIPLTVGCLLAIFTPYTYFHYFY